jgi:5'-nucleotidase
MRLLLTNDDGIDAPGLAALRRAAAGCGDISVIAPAKEWSGCGHQVTTGRPFRIERRPDGTIAVHGTPADCVRVALDHLATDTDWVLAGINHGGNLGTDLHHSGTVAAVREAALHGRPGIAFSQYRRRGLDVDWQRAAEWVGALLPRLLAGRPASGCFLNVNLPHLDAGAPMPAMVACEVDPSPLPLAFTRTADDALYQGDYHQRPRRPAHDVATCFGGSISLSELTV